MKKSMEAKTLLFPTPVLLVGTYDDQGQPNLMTAAWGESPCVSLALRKATYSYLGIVEHKAFTIGIPSEGQMREADYLGIASGRNTDKFAAIGFTPVRSELVDAPYAAELPLVLECRLLHTLEIGLHTQFIGEIADVKAEDGVLGEDGLPDILNFDTAHRGYHGIGPLLGKAFSVGKRP